MHIRELLQTIERLYEKYEYKIGPIGVLTGFTVDMILFRRIDLFFENLVLLLYLTIAATGITVVNLYEGGVFRHRLLDRFRLWLPLLMQYAFGGLFSAFSVLYIKSASFGANWPFLAALVVIMIGNEFARKRYIRFTFHMSIFFLALFSFLIFFIPLLFDRLGTDLFILSGILSVGIVAAFVWALARFVPRRIMKARTGLIVSVGTIWVVVNLFYALNIIPPLPLAMKTGDIYHNVTRVTGGYRVVGEQQPWYRRGILPPRVHRLENDPLYAFAAIFAPPDFTLPVVHEWQQYDSDSGNWKTMARLSYSVIGGRDGGYRGYSFYQNISSGKWRVTVETKNGRTIGRIPFIVTEEGIPTEFNTRTF